MMRPTISLLILLISFVLAGCSSKVSETDARRYLEEKIAKNSDSRLELKDFSVENRFSQQYGEKQLQQVIWRAKVTTRWSSFTFDSSFRATQKDSLFGSREISSGQEIEINGLSVFVKDGFQWKPIN